MSEHQYYEFRTLDRRLTRDEMAEIRKFTTRATITSTLFVNEYHFGSFKGNPVELMKLYYDAHLYFSNWGTKILMLRFPLRDVKPVLFEPFVCDNNIDIYRTQTHIVLALSLNMDGANDEDIYYDYNNYDDDYDHTEGCEALSDLIDVREEILNGDFRSLYLVWLGCAEHDINMESEAPEPPVPPGLHKLTNAQKAICKFFCVSDGAIELAREHSSKEDIHSRPKDDYQAWVKQLKPAEQENYLLKALQGDLPEVQSALRNRFCSSLECTVGKVTGRTRDDIAEAVEIINTRLIAEEKARKAKAAKLAAAKASEERKKHLEKIRGQESLIWKKAEEAINLKKAAEYKIAIQLLTDLYDLAKSTPSESIFLQKIEDLKLRHSTKTAFLRELKRAGFVRTSPATGVKPT